MAEGKLCGVGGCGKPFLALGLCSAHYCRSRKYGDPLGGGPPRPDASARRSLGSPCKHSGCDGVTARGSAGGFCQAHYRRAKLGADMDCPVKRKEGLKRRLDKLGYIYWIEKGHPLATKSGRVHEHRAVMSGAIGRPLLPGENVHHKNGKRDDNCPDNLELWVTSQPAGQRPRDLVAWANMILERYGDFPELA